MLSFGLETESIALQFLIIHPNYVTWTQTENILFSFPIECKLPWHFHMFLRWHIPQITLLIL